MKFRDVMNGIEKCALTWVVKGETFRTLTEQEAAAARAKQAFERDPLPYAEIHGLKFAPPLGQEEAYRNSRRLIYEAYRFMSNPVPPELLAECQA